MENYADSNELIGAVFRFGLVGVVAAILIGQLYFQVLPPGITDVLPMDVLFKLVEGFGYYIILIFGPIAFMYLVLGVGALTAVITHFLVEQYV